MDNHETETCLNLLEIRQVLRFHDEGGEGNCRNLIHAARSALFHCQGVVSSPVFRSMRTPPTSREEFESDLACLIASYRFALARLKPIAESGDESAKRLEEGLDANLRNLLKTLQKNGPAFLDRLSRVQPSNPREATRITPPKDRDLLRIETILEREDLPVPELAETLRALLARREALLKEIRENPACSRELPEESLMKGLVKALESLERILKGFAGLSLSEGLSSLVAAVRNVATLFGAVLEKQGVYRMSVRDRRFDLDLVEIVEKRHTAKTDRHHVTKVLDEGFFYLGKPIKVARVEVAVRPGQE